MPKSMKQPDMESLEDYFLLYFQDQYNKVTNELTRMNKRLDKIEHARKIYVEKFGKAPVLKQDKQ